MLTNLLALIVLTGLTAAALLVCLAKWRVLQAWEVRRPWWLMKRCDFCAGYWLSVLVLLGVAAVAIGCQHAPVGLSCLALLILLPAVLLLALPAAAVCRAVVGPL